MEGFFKCVEFFLNNPYTEVYLRELGKKLKISPYAIKKYADKLIKENLIIEERKANLRFFKANINNKFFKYLKIALNLRDIQKLDLVEYIKNEVSNIHAIVLYGSLAKGENDKKSDIDLVIIGKKKYISFIDIKTDREINAQEFSWSEWKEEMKKNQAFYAEVITHGIPLYGELPLI